MPLIDATSVVNPYAASDRPRLAPAVEVLAQRLDVPEHRITVTAGARDALRSMMTGPVLFSVPTSPAYFDLAEMPVIVHRSRRARTSGSTWTRWSGRSGACVRRRS